MGRRQVIDPRVRAEVIATYGNTCWLGLPGCTVVGEEDDHIVPHSHGGKATVANIRRACKHCNASRQDRVLYGYGARLHMIVCPPGCDAVALDYITEHSRSVDPVVAYSYLADAMGVAAHESRAERVAVGMAWSAAYRSFTTCAEPLDVWCVRSFPSSRRHPRMLDEWLALDYDIHVMDVDYAEAWDHAVTEDERMLVRRWYSLHLSQALVDARQAARRARLTALGLRSDAASVASRTEW